MFKCVLLARSFSVSQAAFLIFHNIASHYPRQRFERKFNGDSVGFFSGSSRFSIRSLAVKSHSIETGIHLSPRVSSFSFRISPSTFHTSVRNTIVISDNPSRTLRRMKMERRVRSEFYFRWILRESLSLVAQLAFELEERVSTNWTKTVYEYLRVLVTSNTTISPDW